MQGEPSAASVLYPDDVRQGAATGAAEEPVSGTAPATSEKPDSAEVFYGKEATQFDQKHLASTLQSRMNLNTAFSLAAESLEAVGIATSGTNRSDAEKVRLARFRDALFGEMKAYQTTNQRPPEQIEIMSMISRLLMPVVIKEPRGFIGASLGIIGEDGFSETEGFMFDAPFKPDGSTLDIVMDYADVPAEWRDAINQEMKVELGREPTPEEVVDRYEEVVLSR